MIFLTHTLAKFKNFWFSSSPAGFPLGIFFICFSLSSSQTLQAESNGKTGFEFLRISPYARSAAMAGANIAQVGDSQSLYSNPAGLAHLPHKEISLQHVSHFQDVAYNHASLVFPHRGGGWGVGFGALTVSDITGTKADSSVTDRFVETGNVDAGDYLLTLSWSRRHHSNLALGFNVKAVQETLDSESAMSFMADVGGIYRRDKRWRFAVVLQNFGTQTEFLSESFSPPAMLRGGVYLKQKKWLEWEGDLIFHLEGSREFAFGAEFLVKNILALRAGYRLVSEDPDLGSSVGLSGGAGFHFRKMHLDYAMIPYGDLGDSHRVTLTWRFAKGAERSTAEASSP